MIFSGYTLDLYCDSHNVCPNKNARYTSNGAGEPPGQFVGETGGWLLHLKERTAICPLCKAKGFMQRMEYTNISRQLPPSSGITLIHNKDGSCYMATDPVPVNKMTDWPWVDLGHCTGFVKGELIMLGTRVRW